MPMEWDCSFCGAKEGQPCAGPACQKAANFRAERDGLAVEVNTLRLQISEAKMQYGCLKIQEEAALKERDNALRLNQELQKEFKALVDTLDHERKRGDGLFVVTVEAFERAKDFIEKRIDPVLPSCCYPHTTGMSCSCGCHTRKCECGAVGRHDAGVCKAILSQRRERLEQERRARLR